MWHVLGRREGHSGFWWGKLREKKPLSSILKRIFKTENAIWTDLAKVRYKWRAVLNTAMNLRVL